MVEEAHQLLHDMISSASTPLYVSLHPKRFFQAFTVEPVEAFAHIFSSSFEPHGMDLIFTVFVTKTWQTT